MVELKGGFLLFEIPLSPWMLPLPGFDKSRKKMPLCLSLVVQPEEEELLKTLNVFGIDLEKHATLFSVSNFPLDK